MGGQNYHSKRTILRVNKTGWNSRSTFRGSSYLTNSKWVKQTLWRHWESNGNTFISWALSLLERKSTFIVHRNFIGQLSSELWTLEMKKAIDLSFLFKSLSLFLHKRVERFFWKWPQKYSVPKTKTNPRKELYITKHLILVIIFLSRILCSKAPGIFEKIHPL